MGYVDECQKQLFVYFVCIQAFSTVYIFYYHPATSSGNSSFKISIAVTFTVVPLLLLLSRITTATT